jgi:glycosyltransferase involved in cell wall biosynthesis
MEPRGVQEPITFAVIGHNEGEFLANSIGQAAEAARPGDRLWFVDGASTDGSPELAASLGAEVIDAPLGKGRAIAAALARCETSHICLIDGDIEYSTSNIPLSLRHALVEEPADMILADFEWPARRLNHSIRGVYRPLVGALFPEALERFGRIPYSGFRMLRADLPLGPLPPGFGVETHFNLLCAANGWPTRVIDVGEYGGPLRRKPRLGYEVGAAIFDVAEAHGRLDSELRPQWDAWLEVVMQVLATQPPLADEPGKDYRERLSAAAARPLPPARRS